MSDAGIDALRVELYRGIGDKGVVLDDLSRLNVFIGPNNAGKSTILRLLAEDAPWNDGMAVQDGTLPHRGPVTGHFRA